MSIVNWKKDENVAVLSLDNGENRHNPTFAAEMKKAFNEMLEDADVHAMVITSSDPKNFSLGVDLGWMLGKFNEKDYTAISGWLHDMNDVFRFAVMCPFPSIAAITGHAFGNGALLSLACDYRFMRGDRGFLCLPEIDLKIQFTPSMLQWVKKSIPYYLAKDMIFSGRKVGAAELEKNHVINKACGSMEETLSEAIAFAKTFHKPRKAMEEMKKRFYKHIVDAIENEDDAYINPPIFMTTA